MTVKVSMVFLLMGYYNKNNLAGEDEPTKDDHSISYLNTEENRISQKAVK